MIILVGKIFHSCVFGSYSIVEKGEYHTCGGKTLYCLLTNVAERVAGITMLHCYLAKFQPFSSDCSNLNFKENCSLMLVYGASCSPFQSAVTSKSKTLFGNSKNQFNKVQNKTSYINIYKNELVD